MHNGWKKDDALLTPCIDSMDVVYASVWKLVLSGAYKRFWLQVLNARRKALQATLTTGQKFLIWSFRSLA